jgi:16S rRNA (guanine(1405)-N(7))-methyltransferase
VTAEESRDAELDALVTRVLASRKYRNLLPGFVAQVAERERRLGRRRGDALRATKSRLHQSVAAFRSGRSYADLRRDLARGQDSEGLRGGVHRMMDAHASTRERLPILEQFCHDVLGPFAGARRVLDLGCRLFPLGLPFMPFAEGVGYRACDVDLEVVELLNDFFRIARVDGEAFAYDLSRGPPAEDADIALLLKSFPGLEHLEPGAGLRVVEEVRAPVVVVSFPAASLGGGRRDMGTHHEERFRTQLAGKTRQLECRRLPGEVVFVVRK